MPAPAILDRLFKQVRKRGQDFTRLTAEERHSFRIACKRLRYSIDYFHSLYPEKDAKRFLRPLRRVQDDLGELNDVHIARAILLAANQSKSTGPSVREALSWLERAASEKTGALGRNVGRLRRSSVSW